MSHGDSATSAVRRSAYDVGATEGIGALTVELSRRRRVSADVGWNRGLGILTFRVNVKPWTPDANKTIFLEEAFRDCILREVCAVREAD